MLVFAILVASAAVGTPARAAITAEGMCGTIAQGAIQDKSTKWGPYGAGSKTAAAFRNAVVDTSNISGPKPDLYTKIDDRLVWYFVTVTESSEYKGFSTITCKAYIDGSWSDLASIEGSASVSGTGKVRAVTGRLRLSVNDCMRGLNFAGVVTLGDNWSQADPKAWSNLWEARRSERGTYFTLKRPVRYKELDAAWWRRATTPDPSIPNKKIHVNPKDSPFHPDNIGSKGADANTYFTANYTSSGQNGRYICYTYSGITGGWEYAGEYSTKNGVDEYQAHYPVFTQKD